MKYLNPFTDGAPFEFRYHLGPEDLLVLKNQVQFTIDDISLDNSHFAGNIGLLLVWRFCLTRRMRLANT